MKFRLKNWDGFSMLAVKLQPSSMDARPRKQTVSSTSAWSTSMESTHCFHRGWSLHPRFHLLLGHTSIVLAESRSDWGASYGAPQQPPSGQPQGHGCRNRSAAAHKAAFPTCWKVVSQSSGLRETSNTSSGLAEIFIHLHFQICSTFSLYKYRGSSWTLCLTEPTCPFYLMSQLFFWPVRINIFVCWFCSSLGKRNRWQVICAFLLCI